MTRRQCPTSPNDGEQAKPARTGDTWDSSQGIRGLDEAGRGLRLPIDLEGNEVA